MQLIDNEQSEAQVVYAFDAYCGWCYGFGPTVEEFWERNRGRVPFSVVNGGLFLGARRLPLGTFGHIAAANDRISRVTGASFGEPYRRLLRDGTLVLDSEAAAIGYAALRAEAPDRAIELANAVQRAFFERGRSLSDVETFTDIASRCGFDPARVSRFMTGPPGRAAALHDFSLARALGAHAFPALLVTTEHAIVRLGGIDTSAAALTRALDRALESSYTWTTP